MLWEDQYLMGLAAEEAVGPIKSDYKPAPAPTDYLLSLTQVGTKSWSDTGYKIEDISKAKGTGKEQPIFPKPGSSWEGVPWEKIADQVGKVGRAATDFWVSQRQLNLLSEQQKQLQKQQQQLQKQQQVSASFTAPRGSGGFGTSTVLLVVGALGALGLTIWFLTKRRP